MSSGYFRDRFQGVGAIAAAAPAPRSAPAPTMRARRAGGTCPQGCFPLADGTCDCPSVTGMSARPRRRGYALGAIIVDGENTSTSEPSTISTKSPLRQIMPVVMAPASAPSPTKTPTRPPLLTTSTGVGPGATIAPTPPGYLPPRVHPKANTAGGGAGSPGSPAYSGGGLTQMAPPENEEALPGSAMTGNLPKGAAKIWLVLGLAGVGYLGYRHLKKKRRKR